MYIYNIYNYNNNNNYYIKYFTNTINFIKMEYILLYNILFSSKNIKYAKF